MNGQKIITNKDSVLKNMAANALDQLEDIGKIDKYNIVDHASIYEWEFDSSRDAEVAANILANHFEFCQRR